jgi:hypothetical protein
MTKLQQAVPNPDNTIDYSFNLTAEYVLGENCSYIHQNAMSYCGESSLDDCKNCRRQGCTVIQCGNETGPKTNPKFVII